MPAILPPWLQVSPSQFGEAASRGAQLGVERAKLAEDARQANMRSAMQAASIAAETKAREDEMRRKEQEAAISHQYEKAQLGLRTQAQDQAEAQFGWEVQQAANKSQAMQAAAARIRAGEDPNKVWSEIGPQAGLTGAGLGSVMRQGFSMGSAQKVAGAPGWLSVGNHLIREQAKVPEGMGLDPVLSNTTGEPIPGMYWTVDQYGNRVAKHFGEVDPMKAQAAEMMKQRMNKLKGNSESPVPAQKPTTKTANSLPEGFKEGQEIVSKSTGRRGRIVNGVPVWYPEPEPETPVAEENAYPNTGLPGTTGFYYSGENYDIPAR